MDSLKANCAASCASLLCLAFAANRAGAQDSAASASAGVAPAAAPAVGTAAPDFTLPAAGQKGPAGRVRLADHKGHVVVIAFYPGDNTTGCTAEFGRFRDDYDNLFGRDVVVLPISVDDLASHEHWATDMKFNFTLLSDTAQTVAARYGSTLAGRKFDGRTVFVVGRDGLVTYRNMKFNALSEDAYKELGVAIAAAKAR
jgi:peroxiredoxin Q/BCP